MRTLLKLAAVSLGLWATAASATDATLAVSVGGQIKPRPKWVLRNTTTEVAGVTLPVDLYATKDNAMMGSSPVALSLLDAPAATADIVVVAPSGCTIGGYSAPNANTALNVSNGTQVTNVSPGTPKTVTISSGASGYFGIALFLYDVPGDTSGAVSCSASGSATFTY